MTLIEQLEELAFDFEHAIPCSTVKDISNATIIRQAISELKAREEFEPIGWIQEIGHGRKSFFEGDLDPREVHDNGKPCYRVFAVKP